MRKEEATTASSMARSSRGKRLRKGIFVLLAAMISVATGIGILSASAAPPKPGEIKMWYTEPSNLTLREFHVNVPGLPIGFRDTDSSLHLYHAIEVDGKRYVYCIEVQNHTFPNTPTPSDTPHRKLSNEQQQLLHYVLAQGPEFLDAADDSAVKSYSAAQIVAWLITENVYKDTTVLDAVLFPATGYHPDTAGFAQTLEIGRLGRSYLNNAWAHVNGNTPILQPSFTSTDPGTAPLYPMVADSSGSYTVSLPDTAGSLGDNWFAGRLRVADSAGLDIAVTDNTMTITGTPKGEALIKLITRQPVGKLQYLLEGNMQEVARFMFARYENQEFYLRLKVDDPTQPTQPPGPTEPPTQPSEPPTQPTEPPTKPSEPPTQPSEPPTKPSEPPTQPTEPPTQPTKPPTHPTQPPKPTQPPSPTKPPTVSTGGMVFGAKGSSATGIALIVGGSGVLIALAWWVRKEFLSR